MNGGLATLDTVIVRFGNGAVSRVSLEDLTLWTGATACDVEASIASLIRHGVFVEQADGTYLCPLGGCR